MTSLHKENLFMSIARHPRRLLCLAVVPLVLLGILFGSFSANTVAHAAPAKQKWTLAHLFGARPLWKYAQKISLASAGNGQIPPCLISAVPPPLLQPAADPQCVGHPATAQ